MIHVLLMKQSLNPKYFFSNEYIQAERTRVSAWIVATSGVIVGKYVCEVTPLTAGPKGGGPSVHRSVPRLFTANLSG